MALIVFKKLKLREFRDVIKGHEFPWLGVLMTCMGFILLTSINSKI